MLFSIVGAGLTGLLALPRANGQSTTASAVPGEITSDTYFYGESPPVYPSPDITGLGDWAAALVKAKAMVKQMTLAEMVNITGGASPTDNSCVGWTPPIPRLGFPGLCLNDAGEGIRATDFVSSWGASNSIAASWNKQLAYNRGLGQGGECVRKGVNIILGPVVAPQARIVLDGRNFEGFGSDPYLNGALAFEAITGVQSTGTQTSTKHFIGYEQETNRNPEGDVQSVSSNIDDKTIHELYLWPFQDAVHAGTTNVMCSYNRINNSYASANSKTLNGLLKTELGFQGFVVSDWGAQHAGVASALGGLDMAMPSPADFWGTALVDAVNNGSVPHSRVEDMATRIIAAWYQLKQDKIFTDPGKGMARSYEAPHAAVEGFDARENNPILRQIAQESCVMVKNTNNALPLKSPKMLNLFGYSAKLPDQYTVASSLTPPAADPVTNGVAYLNGTMITAAGSGSSSPLLAIAPFDALIWQAYSDSTALYWDFESTDPEVDGATDACLVFGNVFSTEGLDRPAMSDDYTDQIILNVAAKCANTIVIFHNAGARLVEAFADHPNVTAIIFAHGPGQLSGIGLVDVLYGEVSPSGKLPYTVAHNSSDYGNLLSPAEPEGIFTLFPQANFTEGVYVDYRYFDQQGIIPRYEFGFGLSYATFEYGDLRISKTSSKGVNQGEYPRGAIAPGGPTDLWDDLVTVTATIRNTAKVAGAEVAQLYLGIPSPGGDVPDTPVRQLRGFNKPTIKAGSTETVSFSLTRRDLSIWDVVAQKWLLQHGEYKVYVGSSSRDLPLTGTFTI
ncbi:glycoside hydrolase family 3 protein [Penicillium lagena]|uniref:glycoside hydrolase family 3 protein n=1 Tax=Penicillium lagena TaxID=94218 RepID=UPI002541F4EC|nr:glycoside hydrolase family 3 protein [Penicillium lagena]KAJ5626337.1 glycoside hydrolase family 3 protein [Penicillium lagena]